MIIEKRARGSVGLLDVQSRGETGRTDEAKMSPALALQMYCIQQHHLQYSICLIVLCSSCNKFGLSVREGVKKKGFF